MTLPGKKSVAPDSGWFLGYRGLPAALIRSGSPCGPPCRAAGQDVARVVAVPWLLGEATGALTITAVVRGRMAHRFHAVWRQLRNRRLDLRQVLTLEPAKGSIRTPTSRNVTASDPGNRLPRLLI